MQRRLRSVSASAQTQCHVLRDSKASYEKNLFAKIIEKHLDDNSVFNQYLCQFYDTEANDINRLVCGHPLHLDLHYLQSSLSFLLFHNMVQLGWFFLFIWNFANLIFIVSFFSVL